MSGDRSTDKANCLSSVGGEANEAGDKTLTMDGVEEESGLTGSGLAGWGVSRELSGGHCSVRWLVVEVRKRSTLASAR